MTTNYTHDKIMQVARDISGLLIAYDSRTGVLRDINNQLGVIDQRSAAEQSVSDRNESVIRKQRVEIDTKTRIMNYTENDMNRNFRLLNAQYIVLLTLLCMVVFVLLWAFLEFFIDSSGSRLSLPALPSRIVGGLRSFFSMK